MNKKSTPITNANKGKAPNIRTIHNAIKEIKRIDPDSDFTESALRELLNAGNIPFVQIGNRKLVNMDTLIAYLSFSCYNKNDEYTVSSSSMEV